MSEPHKTPIAIAQEAIDAFRPNPYYFGETGCPSSVLKSRAVAAFASIRSEIAGPEGDSARAMIAAAMRGEFKKSALRHLHRFQSTDGFASPSGMAASVREMRDLFDGADMGAWGREERRRTKARIRAAIRSQNRKSEKLARTILRNLGSTGGYVTMEQIEEAANRVFFFAGKTKPVTKAKTRSVERDMIAVAARAMKARIGIYATASRHFEASPEAIRAEEKGLFDLYFYARYAEGMGSCRTMMNEIAAARAENQRRAAQQAAKTAKKDEKTAPKNKAIVTPIDSVRREPVEKEAKKAVFGIMAGRIPDILPPDQRKGRSIQMAAAEGFSPQMQG